ncbi:MAG: cation:proton antiporter [Nocardioides sp.]|nr:cation:proton antiporter [Nocardioides sp.]
MTIDLFLVVVGLLGLVVAALSEQLRRLPVSEPLLALVAGCLLGPEVAGLLDLALLTEEPGAMHDGARILLAVSVMAVALRFPAGVAWRHRRPVAVLLLLAMPAMALLSGVVAWWSLGVPLAAAALLGAAVAPTDPVLASSVVSGRLAERDLPDRDRELLSLESGFNDGLALPLVLAALAVAGATSASSALLESVWQVVGAVALGAVLGWAGARALRAGERHGATAHGPALLLTLLLRRVPVLLALARPLRLRLRDALYLGWFGPVGVSALFYLTLEAERMSVPPTVLAAGSLVVVASTVVHGLTAAPGRAAYRRAAQG